MAAELKKARAGSYGGQNFSASLVCRVALDGGGAAARGNPAAAAAALAALAEEGEGLGLALDELDQLRAALKAHQKWAAAAGRVLDRVLAQQTAAAAGGEPAQVRIPHGRMLQGERNEKSHLPTDGRVGYGALSPLGDGFFEGLGFATMRDLVNRLKGQANRSGSTLLLIFPRRADVFAGARRHGTSANGRGAAARRRRRGRGGRRWIG
eukprot:1188140-Prorocentrum_minimum.AAC.5